MKNTKLDRKTPRTLEDAFGPYSRHPIIDPADEKMPVEDKILCAVALVMLVAIFILVGLGY